MIYIKGGHAADMPLGDHDTNKGINCKIRYFYTYDY
jgi:hypothetical protein